MLLPYMGKRKVLQTLKCYSANNWENIICRMFFYFLFHLTHTAIKIVINSVLPPVPSLFVKSPPWYQGKNEWFYN